MIVKLEDAIEWKNERMAYLERRLAKYEKVDLLYEPGSEKDESG